MKKYILTLLLFSCSEKKEQPVVYGDSVSGYTVSYQGKILWSESASDTVRMKEKIVK
jgi:hypothetical protein